MQNIETEAPLATAAKNVQADAARLKWAAIKLTGVTDVNYDDNELTKAFAHAGVKDSTLTSSVS